jgi:hypothetical protein
VAFPSTPLPVTVELQLGGTWTDITSKVYVRDPITIRRGRSSEGQNVDPSTCQLTLDNRDGRFSPRNPSGAYYGLIGRNTPLRVSVTGLDDNSLQTNGTANAYAQTPTAAALNVTTDLDLRVDLVGFDLYSRSMDLIGKWDVLGGQRSYLLWLSSGYPFLSWWNGTAQIDVQSTVQLPRDNGRRFSIRASLTASTGTVTFYWSDDFATWRQLGAPVVMGATTVASSTAAVRVARSVSSGVSLSPVGRFYRAQIRTGAGASSLVANPDFTVQTAGATSFTDSTGKAWTVSSPAVISSTNVRFVGEVSAWPVRWDYGEDDVYVPIQASGILRRLLANQPPLRSTLRRSIPAQSSVMAYWPMEDATGATSFAFGLSDPRGQYPMSLTGAASLSSYTGFLASDPLPQFANGAYARGKVPPFSSTGYVQLRWLQSVPSTSLPADNTVLAKLTTSNVIWTVLYKTGGNVEVTQTSTFDGALLGTSGLLGMSLVGSTLRMSLELTQNGANIDCRLAKLVPGASSGLFFTFSLTSQTLGSASYVQVGAPGTNSSVAIGHVTVENAVTSLFDFATQLNAYQSETAGTRAKRLATEEGYPLYLYGPGPTEAMGAQVSDELIDLLRQCAESDQGILLEARGTFALAFRGRATMMARDASLTLDYAQQHLTDFEPVEDDKAVVNDVVLTRILGSSYNATVDVGTLSTQAPPNGVGRYQQATSVSLYTDAQLRDQANYRLALGTIDEPRYPQIGIGLHRTPTLAVTRAALDTDVGDVVQVNNPATFYAPFSAMQRVEGITEVLAPYSYDVVYNTSPGSLWRGVAVYDDPTGRTRYDTDSSTLAASATSTATTVSVATTSDSLVWTTAPADLPFQVIIAGEVMTVTAVSGTTSPQTLTVTRSVNGVVKAQAAGASVNVYTPSYYGF